MPCMCYLSAGAKQNSAADEAIDTNVLVLPNGRPNPCDPAQYFQWPLDSPDVYCWKIRDSAGVCMYICRLWSQN
jgi:hypothetical protein